jgi:hypothetical protein
MTTKSEIAGWFDAGVERSATHLIVVCDTYDWEDYPVYATSDADAVQKYNHHHGPNMQRVMEVYDLRMDRTSQLSERRAFHLPPI